MRTDEQLLLNPLLKELGIEARSITADDAVKHAARAVKRLKEERNRYKAEVQEVAQRFEQGLF